MVMKLLPKFIEHCLLEFHRSRGEEWSNFVTHVVGAVFGVVALVLMLVLATPGAGYARRIVCGAIYGA